MSGNPGSFQLISWDSESCLGEVTRLIKTFSSDCKN